MPTITAIYEDGVLKPKEPLDLPPQSEVRVTIEPIHPQKARTGNLLAFLKSLPSLGEDAELFAQDIRAIRAEFPAEPSSWD